MAKLAAVLFVLQTALTAFATGAGAAPVIRDQFGNVLCTAEANAGHGDPAAPDPKEHGGVPDCCRLGCSIGSDRFSPPVPVVLEAPRRGTGHRLTLPARRSAEPSRGSGETRARAPPAAT